jgi:hypothetical protein
MIKRHHDVVRAAGCIQCIHEGRGEDNCLSACQGGSIRVDLKLEAASGWISRTQNGRPGLVGRVLLLAAFHIVGCSDTRCVRVHRVGQGCLNVWKSKNDLVGNRCGKGLDVYYGREARDQERDDHLGSRVDRRRVEQALHFNVEIVASRHALICDRLEHPIDENCTVQDEINGAGAVSKVKALQPETTSWNDSPFWPGN